MLTNNPFSSLAEIIPAIAMQGFVLAMAALTLVGVLVDIIHKKNVKYFFENAKKSCQANKGCSDSILKF